MGCRPELLPLCPPLPTLLGVGAQVARPQRAVEGGGQARNQGPGGSRGEVALLPVPGGGGARQGGEQRAMNTNDVTSQLSISRPSL